MSSFQRQYLGISSLPFFADMDRAYAALDPRLRAYYQEEPTIQGLEASKERRSKSMSPVLRKHLAQTVLEQYSSIDKAYGQALAQRLEQEHCFSVCTAHQPMFLAGPLYFISKICDCIALARELRKAWPQDDIVPVYWMGGEDHDFEEISSIELFGQPLQWNYPATGGPVGQMPLEAMQEPLDKLADLLGRGATAQEWLLLWQKHYREGKGNFAQATHAWLHELFASEGLLILRPNKAMKEAVLPVFERELRAQESQQLVEQTLEEWKTLGLKAQASPRKINLFYLSPGSRSRIVSEGKGYKTAENTKNWGSLEELLAELREAPEYFSPNVILRPLMQEQFLPNLAYIGGGGELAYWLQLKNVFELHQVPYPVLLRRSSFVFFERKSLERLEDWETSPLELLSSDAEALLQEILRRTSKQELSLQRQKEALQRIFLELAELIKQEDASLEGAVLAQSAQVEKQVDKWEKRLMRQAKQRETSLLQQYQKLRDKIFPHGSFQERGTNIMALSMQFGPGIIQELIDAARPLDACLVLLLEDEQ